MKVVFSFLFVLLMSSCALIDEVKTTDTNVNVFSNDNFTKRIRDRGDVLVEREAGDHRYIVMREKNRIIKYDIYDVQEKVGLKFTNTRTDTVAIIDEKLKTCFTLVNNDPVKINCEKLSSDQDLAQFLP